MTDKKQWRELRQKLAQQGCSFTETKNSHIKVYGPDGQLVSTMQKSGSDWRAHKNLTARLRRAGFQV